MLNEVKEPYLFLTLHRPSNVDDRATFSSIVEAVNRLASGRTVFFPVHPGPDRMIEHHGIGFSEKVQLLPPLGFRESLALWSGAEAVLTDSGGLQEETTALGIPCVTIRENTERPVTVRLEKLMSWQAPVWKGYVPPTRRASARKNMQLSLLCGMDVRRSGYGRHCYRILPTDLCESNLMRQ